MKSIYLIGDVIFINIAFLSSFYLKFKSLDALFLDQYFSLFLVFNVVWFFAVYIQKSYDVYRVSNYEKVIGKLLNLFIIHGLMITAFWVFKKAYYYSREHLMYTYIFLIPLVTMWRAGVLYTLKRYRKKGFNFRKVVIAGWDELSSDLEFIFKHNPDLGYRLVGIFDDVDNAEKINGKIADIEKFSSEEKIDEIYCSMSSLENEQVKNLIEFADNNLIRIKMIPDMRGVMHKSLRIDFYEHLPILIPRTIPLDDAYNRLIKRVFDIIFSFFVIVFLLSWLFPIIAFLIKISSKGPVLFRQMRSGKNNDDFWCWKFRTMKVNEVSDVLQASKNDSRITKIGAFLRKTSLDELPQFFNVFTGQMSVVGPRPHMIKHTEEYSQIIDKYMVRHFVKPGITGLAQVKGYRGETKDPQMMRNRIKMDMLYIENWSFLLDIRIIVQTIIGAFRKQENAY